MGAAGRPGRPCARRLWETGRAGGDTAIATYAVLTSSDRGARAEPGWTDLGGDAVVDLMTAAGHSLSGRRLLADDQEQLSAVITAWCEPGGIDIVLTTGGTGLGPRDVMPEATARVLDFEVPGIAEAMRALTRSTTPMAMLSRARSGVRGRTLIVNLPGNPKAVRECLNAVLPVIAHAADILRDRHKGPHPR